MCVDFGFCAPDDHGRCYLKCAKPGFDFNEDIDTCIVRGRNHCYTGISHFRTDVYAGRRRCWSNSRGKKVYARKCDWGEYRLGGTDYCQTDRFFFVIVSVSDENKKTKKERR